MRASRSLLAMKTELEELESSREVDANSQNQLVDSSKEAIRVYHQLTEQLLEIELERKMENLSEEKANMLIYLQRQFDDSIDIEY